MSTDIETLRGIITHHVMRGTPVQREALAALDRLVADRDSLRKALDDRHAADKKAWSAIMRATGKERGLPDNKEVIAFYVAEVERLERLVRPADMFDPTKRSDVTYKDLWEALSEQAAEDHKFHVRENDSLRAEVERLEKVVEGDWQDPRGGHAALEEIRATLTKLRAARPDDAPAQINQNASGPLPYSRDELGRMVRDAWISWATTQSNPKPSWLVPYDQLIEADKEADRIIGERVARFTWIGLAARASLSDAPAQQTQFPKCRKEPVDVRDFIQQHASHPQQLSDEARARR